jgi:hypothetical protein
VGNRPKAPQQLTPRQTAILMYGHSDGIAGRGFLSEAAELSAWMSHRGELLAAAGSAGRPAAYLKFELAEAEPEWISDLQVLFDRGFLQAPRETAAMVADQASDLHAEFESPELIRRLELPTPMLEGICREMGHVLAYHRYRGRAASIEKYERIGAAIREVLRESLIPLKKESIQ